MCEEAKVEVVESMEDIKEELEASLKKGPVNDDPAWDKFETMLAEKTVFTVKVDSAVKAGVVAFVDGVRGFIPASKLSTSYVENLEEFAGKDLDVIVITADRAAKKLVLSAREAIKVKQKAEKEAAMAALEVGQEFDGTVDSLQEYGAFINLDNGLSGLLHVSQISYKRVEKPADVLQKGQKVHVKLIAIKDGKLSLSIKALTEAPARKPRADKPERAPREDRGESNYKDPGKATTSLGDLLKGIQL